MSARATVTETALAGVVVVEPRVFGDDRGFFFESYNAKTFAEPDRSRRRCSCRTTIRARRRGVLRGLHYQIRAGAGQAGARHGRRGVRRRGRPAPVSSPTFGRWSGVVLSAANKQQLWIPPGFAHGFLVLTESAEFLYKTTDYWAPEHERTLLWNDPAVGVEWPLDGEPQLAAKDRAGKPLADAETFA